VGSTADLDMSGDEKSAPTTIQTSVHPSCGLVTTPTVIPALI